MKFERRAEGVEVQKLVETFVDVGALFTLLGTTDHQVINGRRGTGKTHALTYLAQSKKSPNNIAIYCDLRSVGSNTSIYADPTRDLSERATRLLMDVISVLHNSLADFCIENSEKFDLSRTGPALDVIAESIGDVRVVGTTELEQTHQNRHQTGIESGYGISIGHAGLNPSLSAKDTTSTSASNENRSKETGTKIYHVNFGSLMAAFQNLLSLLPNVRLWILLDEWSALPSDLQPYLADLIRRCIFPVRGITVKIAAIEQRTRFKIDLPSRSYIGLQIGADVPSDINLDDFMVFENQPERARAFYRELFFKHFNTMDNAKVPDAPKNPESLLSMGFTQLNVFDEFVQAAEGVPRDAMNIISMAASRVLDEKIGMKQIRDAARDWYQRDKERDLVANAESMSLLHYIVDEVIDKKNARAFLLKSNIKNELIDDLFDARVLHLLKKNISGKDTPGERYDVYKIDYGCYVELINTAKAPRLFLGFDDDQNDVGIPQDDYRAIRRAILDLDAFAHRRKIANLFD